MLFRTLKLNKGNKRYSIRSSNYILVSDYIPPFKKLHNLTKPELQSQKSIEISTLFMTMLYLRSYNDWLSVIKILLSHLKNFDSSRLLSDILRHLQTTSLIYHFLFMEAGFSMNSIISKPVGLWHFRINFPSFQNKYKNLGSFRNGKVTFSVRFAIAGIVLIKHRFNSCWIKIDNGLYLWMNTNWFSPKIYIWYKVVFHERKSEIACPTVIHNCSPRERPS